MNRFRLFPFLLLVAVTVSTVADVRLDLPPGRYQKDYSPADKTTVTENPPPFIWVPPRRDLTYSLDISRDARFPDEKTLQFDDLDRSVHCLKEPLEPGDWFWRYGVEQDDDVQWSCPRSFVVPEGVSERPFPNIDSAIARVPKERPHLFILAEELPEYRERCREELKPLLDQLKRRADSAIGKELVPEPPYVQGEGPERGKHYAHIFRTTRPPMDAMEYCGLAYLLSGERKYGEEAKRRILHFFSWDPNGSTSHKNNDEPSMWVMMRGVRAYDWTYDLFSPEERSKVEAVMRIRAKQFYDHLHGRFETSPYSSHDGRTIGFLGEAALEFCHDWPEAREWLDYVLQAYWSVYPAWAEADGGWHEGPSYWSYYMSFVLHFVVPLRTATGIDLMQKPFFQNTPYYKLYTNPPYAEISPFGDGEHSPPRSSMGQLMYQFSTLLEDPYIRWYAAAMDAGPGSGILGITLADDTIEAKNPSVLPSTRYFPGVGLVSMHTALGKADEDVHFLFHSDPYGAISHAHADQNAFTLEAYGEALAIASGYYPWYGSLHHKNWQWHSKSSNMITINGGVGQRIRSPESKGEIVSFSSGEWFDYCLGDASAAYAPRLDRAERHVLHLRPGVFVIVDDLSAPEPVTFEWQLHSLSKMDINERQNELTIKQGNSRCWVSFVVPEKLRLTQTDQFPDPPEDDHPNQWHTTAAVQTDNRAMRFITVMCPYREGDRESLPQIDYREGDDASGLHVRKGEVEYLVGFRTDPKQIESSVSELSSTSPAYAVRLEGDDIAVFSSDGGEVHFRE